MPTVLWIADDAPMADAQRVSVDAPWSPSDNSSLWLPPTAARPGEALPRISRALAQQGRRLDAVVVAAEAVDLDDGMPVAAGVGAHLRAAWLEWADRVVGDLSSHARQLRPEIAALDPREDLTGLFDPHTSDRRSAWVRAMNKALPADEGCVIEHRGPLEPARLLAWTLGGLPGVMRARGFVWTVDRPEVVAELDIVGEHATVRPAGTWWVSTALRHWPRSPARRDRIRRDWHPDYGDRTCQVALVGTQLDPPSLRQQLLRAAVPAEHLRDWRDSAVSPSPFDSLPGA